MQITKVIVANCNNGSTWITDTGAHVPTAPRKSWTTIEVINDTVFATLTDGKTENGPSTTSVKAGTILAGNYTVITLASGVVVAYYGEH